MWVANPFAFGPASNAVCTATNCSSDNRGVRPNRSTTIRAPRPPVRQSRYHRDAVCAETSNRAATSTCRYDPAGAHRPADRSGNMARFDARRLAAIDMYGAQGVRWRRPLIVAEFIIGAAGGVALGLRVSLSSQSVDWQLLEAYLICIGINYLALTLHALSLARPGALNTELTSADIRAELRYYTVAQLWVAVPLAVAVFALAQTRRPEAAHHVVSPDEKHPPR